jgi:hypothetical protein
MSEPIQKLFTTRAEQYPEPTAADVAQGTARAALAGIPAFGGSITEVLSMVLAPAVARRRDTWFKELADALEEAERKIDGFRVENLTQDEAFVSAVIEATRSAISTQKDEKRVLLRNALLNIATGRAPGEDKQHIYLRLIDEFTPSHVKALKLIWRGSEGKNLWEMTKTSFPKPRNYGNAIQRIVPELMGQESLVHLILVDLRNRGFSNLSGPEVMFPHAGAAPITDSGIEFLRFVLSEQELPK